jgi:hypothetical protein
MTFCIRLCSLLICLSGILSAQGLFIDKAFSANDHLRKKPLIEALEYGFNGVSAEVELKKDGKLYCGSSLLKEAYLNPLRLRTNNGETFVHSDHTDEFILFLEVISDSNATYTALMKELDDYHPMMTSYDGKIRSKKSIRVVIGGKVPHLKMYEQTQRWIFAEEVITKLDYSHDGSFCSLASLRMKKLFDWKGDGTMPNMQYHSLGSYMKNAHKVGRWVRVYDLPELPNAFDIIYGAGADFLEIKDLKSFAEYWKNRSPY